MITLNPDERVGSNTYTHSSSYRVSLRTLAVLHTPKPPHVLYYRMKTSKVSFTYFLSLVTYLLKIADSILTYLMDVSRVSLLPGLLSIKMSDKYLYSHILPGPRLLTKNLFYFSATLQPCIHHLIQMGEKLSKVLKSELSYHTNLSLSQSVKQGCFARTQPTTFPNYAVLLGFR